MRLANDNSPKTLLAVSAGRSDSVLPARLVVRLFNAAIQSCAGAEQPSEIARSRVADREKVGLGSGCSSRTIDSAANRVSLSSGLRDEALAASGIIQFFIVVNRSEQPLFVGQRRHADAYQCRGLRFSHLPHMVSMRYRHRILCPVTPRQQAVAMLIRFGLDIKDIAYTLGIGIKAVHWHIYQCSSPGHDGL